MKAEKLTETYIDYLIDKVFNELIRFHLLIRKMDKNKFKKS
jgi:hypothetical protein